MYLGFKENIITGCGHKVRYWYSVYRCSNT